MRHCKIFIHHSAFTYYTVPTSTSSVNKQACSEYSKVFDTEAQLPRRAPLPSGSCGFFITPVSPPLPSHLSSSVVSSAASWGPWSHGPPVCKDHHFTESCCAPRKKSTLHYYSLSSIALATSLVQHEPGLPPASSF